MFRQVTALFSIGVLLCSGKGAAIECTNPFPNLAQFQIVEQLKCNGVTNPVVLQITSVNASASTSSPFLAPGCDNTSVYFNMYKGAEILDFSNTVENVHSKTVFISKACDGIREFLINREPLLYTLPSKDKVNTSVRVFSEDANASLLAYVRADEDNANNLVLRDSSGSIIVTAIKVLKNTPGNGDFCAQGIWTVTSLLATEQNAKIVSFLLTLKDNTSFSCTPTQPPAVSAMSAGAIILGVAIGAVLVIAGGVGIACYCAKHNPRYAKVRLIQ